MADPNNTTTDRSDAKSMVFELEDCVRKLSDYCDVAVSMAEGKAKFYPDHRGETRIAYDMKDCAKELEERYEALFEAVIGKPEDKADRKEGVQ